MPFTPAQPRPNNRTATQTAIAKFISANADGDARLGQLLAWSVGRVLLNNAKGGTDWSNECDNEAFRHIKDWLKAALVNEEPWLRNIDAYGRPKKLLKFSTIGDITKEADKAMLKTSQRLSNVQIIEGDEEIYATLGDGYYLVRLLTAAALDRESAKMQHCIGNGAYDDLLNNGQHTYLSLRDAHGKPHATLEIVFGCIVQLQGKQNDPPVKRYVDRLIPYIRGSDLAVHVPASHLGYVIDIEDEWHPIDNLPEGLTVRGNLHLSNTKIKSLPLRLAVLGSLFVNNSDISILPEGLKLSQNLDLRFSKITFLPEDLTVGGDLDVSMTAIKSLPKRLTVGGSLRLSHTNIKFLPEGLNVEGDLDLRYTGITSLPEGLKVGKILIIKDTGIRTIPNSIDDETIILYDKGPISTKISAKKFRELYGAEHAISPAVMR